MFKYLVFSVVLVVSLLFSSQAFSGPVAAIKIDADQALVLTDEFHENCPVYSNAAVIINSQGQIARNALGCWVYVKEENSIHVIIYVDDKPPVVAVIPASQFERLVDPPKKKSNETKPAAGSIV